MTKPQPHSERRVYPRIQVDLPGELQISSHNLIPCRIRDLCQDGLLLECAIADDDQVCQRNAQIFIRFDLPTQGSSTTIQTWIQLLQRGDGFFGARFIRLSNAGTTVLRAYLNAPSTSTEESKPITDGIAQTALVILRRITLRCLDDLTKSVLDEMQDALWAANGQADSVMERSDIVSDIARLERAVQQRRFQERLRRELTDKVVQPKITEDVTVQNITGLNSDMSLIDQDGFELWLAVSALVERLERQLGETLIKLRAMSVGIFGGNVIISVEPIGLAQSIRQALGTSGISVPGQIVCLRAAAKPLPSPLGIFYQDLINAWVKAGLTPKALPKLRAKPPTNEQQSTNQSVSKPPPQQAATAVKPAISGKVLPRQPTATQSIIPSTVTADTLRTLFATNSVIPVSSEALRSQLATLLSKGIGEGYSSMPKVLYERVNATEQVLAKMLEDSSLPPKARHIIQHLSMRVMAAAVGEPGFFATGSHPLVAILNQLEHLALFLPTQDVPKSQLQQDIDTLMQRALITDITDTLGLQDLSKQLINLQQRLGDEWERYAEQVVVNCEGRELVRTAYRQTRSRLNEVFADQSIHPVIADLAQQSWRVLLQLTWIREGGEGTGWLQYWQTLMDLHQICSFGMQAFSDDRLPALLQVIREGLRITSFDSYQRIALEERIESALRMARLRLPAQKVLFTALPAASDEIQDEALPHEFVTSDWVKTLALVDNLAIGSDLRLHHENGERRLRLAWRSRDGRELVFVDPSTLKAKTLGRVALTRALLIKAASPQVEVNQPVVSRATNATLQEMQQRIRYHETHDTVTGLSNRRQLSGILTQLLTGKSDLTATSQVSSTFELHVLGFLDLDRFDAMIGICGYSVGEQLLTIVTRLLKNALEAKNPNCLAYLGGSRFAFLLPIVDINAAEYLGRKLCDCIGDNPFVWQGINYPLSCSIGLVMITMASQHSDVLQSAADTACTTAQHNGGGRVVLFNEGNTDIFQHQKRMNDWIQAEAAIKGRRLRLRGQPIAHTANPSDNPHHCEILLSVYDEQGKQLPLEAFIAAAEAFNLMEEIDRLVFTQTIEWVHDNPNQVKALGGVAINLSGQSLSDGSLVDIVQAGLKRYAIVPELISFEVTETAAIANLDQAAAIIMGIRDIGCHFALDDFGVGLSSYTYLKRLPVDYLKIDGSFIKDILRSPNDQVIVKSINEVAHFMGKKTIAEYVENLDILGRLQEMGIDYVQGYAVGKPKFLDEV